LAIYQWPLEHFFDYISMTWGVKIKKVAGWPPTPMFPDRFYTLPQPAKYNKSGRKSKRRPPVDRPADRRPENDSRPDIFLIKAPTTPGTEQGLAKKG
jgi:hypothetical protein